MKPGRDSNRQEHPSASFSRLTSEGVSPCHKVLLMPQSESLAPLLNQTKMCGCSHRLRLLSMLLLFQRGNQLIRRFRVLLPVTFSLTHICHVYHVREIGS